MLSEKELQPYAPFRTDSCFGEERLFTLSLIDDAEDLVCEGHVIADFEDDSGRMTLFKGKDYSTAIDLTAGSCNESDRILSQKIIAQQKRGIRESLQDNDFTIKTIMELLLQRYDVEEEVARKIHKN